MSLRIRMFVIASAGVVALATSAQAQQQPPQSPGMTFFVTSIGLGKGADLGGLEGADRHCQQLATAAGAGSKTWRAYLSTSAAGGATPIHARDRIGRGPWQNFKGAVVATSVDDLHSDNNKLSMENSLTERGTIVSGTGMTPNWHDILVGSQGDGRAWPGNLNLTCFNWTSSTAGATTVGHIDRRGGNMANPFTRSWNAAHQSRGCSQENLIASGGNGLFYCFAAN